MHLPRMLWGFTDILGGGTGPLPCTLPPAWIHSPFFEDLAAAGPAVGRKLPGMGLRFLSSTLYRSLPMLVEMFPTVCLSEIPE